MAALLGMTRHEFGYSLALEVWLEVYVQGKLYFWPRENNLLSQKVYREEQLEAYRLVVVEALSMRWCMDYMELEYTVMLPWQEQRVLWQPSWIPYCLLEERVVVVVAADTVVDCKKEEAA